MKHIPCYRFEEDGPFLPEEMINSTFPQRFSEQCLTLGVETYGNFIIQNALFFIQK